VGEAGGKGCRPPDPTSVIWTTQRHYVVVVRTTVITGSASGMGRAVKQQLIHAGHRVIGVDLRGEEIDADLATRSGRESAVAAVLDASGGRVDGVVVCAGVGPHIEPTATIVAINYFGAIEVLDGLGDALAAGDAPAAVAISSNSIGLVPMSDTELIDRMLDGDEDGALAVSSRFDGASVYGMTKHALARAVRMRSGEWGAKGIRLNAVAPGPVNTPLLQGSIDDPVLGPLVDALPVPLGRRAEPDEIAELVVFLLGPSAAYIHGSIVFADGGTDALVRPDHV
jgi:NAD(P)-dependent dehydrogenase (short-subunit alcohol dehydrogenase family)